MKFRGSLRQCVEACANLFKSGNDKMLAIICCPSAKYYYVCDDEHLTDALGHSAPSDHRLTFRGTERELRTMATNRQAELFKEDPLAYDPNAL